MVAVRSASQASDAAIASELGSLLHVHASIHSERWKAYAQTSIAFVWRRFGIDRPTPPLVLEPTPRILPRHLALLARDPRSIKERSLRAGMLLRHVHIAIAERRFDDALALASEIEPARFWQRGQLALARGYFEANNVREALRRSRCVRDPALVAERQLLLGEIRLAIRPEAEAGIADVVTLAQLRDARPAPTWTELELRPAPPCHDRLMIAAAWTRRGLRTENHDCFDRAMLHLHHVQPTRAARHVFLGILTRSHVDVLEGLFALRTTRASGVVDAYLAEHVAQRAARLEHVHVPQALRRGLAGEPPISADAASVDRSLHDEGLAIAGRRRFILISTSRACLRSALRGTLPWTRDAIDARLRTLVHLGGTLGREAIANALVDEPRDELLWERALDALALIDARVAARVALTNLPRIDNTLLRHIEVLRGVDRGFAHAFHRAREILASRDLDADAWLGELLQTWRARAGRFPDPAALVALAARPDLPSTPSALFAQIDAAGNILASDAHDQIAPKLSRAVIETLVLARPARVDPRMCAWTIARWQELFTKLVNRRDFVEHTTLVQCARVLRCAFRPLRLGDLPALGVPSTVPFGPYRLRFLDKRFDLLTYLRFADVPARSCYRSDCKFYRNDYNTEQAVLDAWKDPLTFCFHIEKDGIPHGFLLGSFAAVARRPAVVLSSLHVRPKTAAVRIAALRAFETAIAQLGIEHIGVANVHGGRGPLPDNYLQRPMTFTRFRALGRDGKRIMDAYDDLAYANEPVTFARLYWRS